MGDFVNCVSFRVLSLVIQELPTNAINCFTDIALALLLNHSSNFHLSFLCSINPAHNIVCELACD